MYYFPPFRSSSIPSLIMITLSKQTKPEGVFPSIPRPNPLADRLVKMVGQEIGKFLPSVINQLVLVLTTRLCSSGEPRGHFRSAENYRRYCEYIVSTLTSGDFLAFPKCPYGSLMIERRYRFFLVAYLSSLSPDSASRKGWLQGRGLRDHHTVRKDLTALVKAHFEDCNAKLYSAYGSLVLWLQTLGYTSLCDDRSFDLFLRRSYYAFVSDSYEPRMKYLTALIQAKHLDDFHELPPCPGLPACSPDETHFLSSRAYKFFESGLKGTGLSGERKRLRLLDAVGKLKKRQPEIPLFRVKDTESGFQSLFSQAIGPSGSLDNPKKSLLTEQDKLLFSDAVDRILKAAIPNVDALLDVSFVPPPMPGLKSRNGASGLQGGTLGYIDRMTLTRLENSLSRLRRSREGSTFHTGVTSKDSVDLVDSCTFDQITPGGVRHVNVSVLVPRFNLRDLHQVLDEVFEHDLEAIPVGLAEPFKVRLISKAGPVMSWYSSCIQHATHQLLQKLPEFQLTRETPGWEISQILQKNLGDSPMGLDEYWVSGDYTGATDNLDPWCSYTVCQKISDKLRYGDVTRNLYVSSLVGHLHKGSFQSWGQLMGSPSSFPVLNFCNLALTLASLSLTEGRWRRPGKSGIVTNGDDIGFRASRRSIEGWQAFTTRGGLSPSVGKNFRSRTFIQLNSKMFIERNLVPEADRYLRVVRYWEEVHCPSLAVLAPPRKVTLREFFLTADSWQRKFLEGQTGSEADRLNSLWLTVWSPYLKHIPSAELNWYVPRPLGGFGLRPTRPFQMNEGQQRAAAWLRDHTQPSLVPRLTFGRAEPLTSTFVEESRVLQQLKKMGVLEDGWLEPGETEFRVPNLGPLMGLSGTMDVLGRSKLGANHLHHVQWRHRLLGDTMYSEMHVPHDTILPANPVRVDYRSTALPAKSSPTDLVSDEQPKLSGVLRILREAARNTPRTMSVEEVLLFNRSPTLRLTPGWSVQPAVCKMFVAHFKPVMVTTRLPPVEALSTEKYISYDMPLYHAGSVCSPTKGGAVLLTSYKMTPVGNLLTDESVRLQQQH